MPDSLTTDSLVDERALRSDVRAHDDHDPLGGGDAALLGAIMTILMAIAQFT